MRNNDDALGSLKQLAGDVSVTGVGPIVIGNIGELDLPNTVKSIAAAYVSAFSQDAKAFPYLMGLA
jgi:hypothetical protein